MPDPYGKVQPGDTPVHSALVTNAMLQAAQKAKRSDLNTLAPLITSTLSATIVRVLNDSGDDLPRNSILGLDGPIFSPGDSSLDTFMQEVTFRGIKPDPAKHGRRYVVIHDPAPKDRVVRAYIMGVCQVKVNVLDESHDYVRLEGANTSHFKSSCFGHARILWREGEEGYGYGVGYETGIQWATVLMGASSSSFAVGKSDGINVMLGTTPGAGSASIYRSDAGHEDGPVETVPVLNYSTTSNISIGIRVAIAWDGEDQFWVSPLECEPYS